MDDSRLHKFRFLFKLQPVLREHTGKRGCYPYGVLWWLHSVTILISERTRLLGLRYQCRHVAAQGGYFISCNEGQNKQQSPLIPILTSLPPYYPSLDGLRAADQSTVALLPKCSRYSSLTILTPPSHSSVLYKNYLETLFIPSNQLIKIYLTTKDHVFLKDTGRHMA